MTSPAESNTNGTPGPWVLCYDGDYDELTDREYRWPWQIVGADDVIVCDFTGGGDVKDGDARLISAAPDLLAALKRALQGLVAWREEQQREHPWSVDGWKIEEEVRAAIAKAEPSAPLAPSRAAGSREGE